MKYITYIIRNLVNGKFYFGSTSNAKKRKYDHFYNLKHNIHDNIYLQRSFNKHLLMDFVFEIVETYPSKETVLVAEQKLLDQHWDNCKRCYNISKHATGGFSQNHSSSTKKKLSKSALLLWKNKAFQQKHSRAKVQLWQTAEYRQNQAKANKRRIPVIAKQLSTGKAIFCESLTDASNKTTVKVQNVSCILKGDYRSCKGWTFMKAEGNVL